FADPSAVATASVLMAVLTAFTLFANSVIILAMTWSKKNRPAKARSNNEIPRHLMTSLAACDLVWGGVGMTLGVAEVAENGRWIFGPMVCVFRLYVTYVWVSVSVYHVNCLAVDRCLAICKPWLYRSLTNKTGYFMVAVSWVVPAALCIGTVSDVITGTETDKNTTCFITDLECMKRLKTFSYGLSIFLAFYGPFLCLYLLNTFLMIKVNFILKKRESIDTNKPYGQVSGNGHPKSGQGSGNIRAFKTVGILVVGFTVCWCPALGIVCLYFNLLEGLPPHLTVVLWMSYINTAVNPFLYCMNRSVRQAVKRLLE
ncbi:unnamed protein product, partial [Lymnaea stagnalis]